LCPNGILAAPGDRYVGDVNDLLVGVTESPSIDPCRSEGRGCQVETGRYAAGCRSNTAQEEIVMAELDVEAGVAALSRARHADERIWPPHFHDTARWRRERNLAVLAAVDAGLPLEQVADDLGVLISDVERMAAAGRIAAV
jgi:hypothetical protein